MPERLLTPTQKIALRDISSLLVCPELDGVMSIACQDLQEVYELPYHEALTTLAVLGLVFANIDGVEIKPKHRRRLSSIIINRDPGRRQLLDEKNQRHHIPGGRYPTGRNRSGRRRARR